jgi:hypothetical protein
MQSMQKLINNSTLNILERLKDGSCKNFLRHDLSARATLFQARYKNAWMQNSRSFTQDRRIIVIAISLGSKHTLKRMWMFLWESTKISVS